MTTPIIMHINYCEQGQSLEEACTKAVKWGYDGIEFRQIPRTGDTDPVKYYDKIARAVERSGLKHVVFGGPPTKIIRVEPSEQEKGIALQEQYIRLAAQRFQMTVWNIRTESLSKTDASGNKLTGSGASDERHWKAAVNAYKHLGDVAEELGIKLAFETHHGNLTDLSSVTRELVDRVNHPYVGVNLDYGNMLNLPEEGSLQSSIQNVGDRLYYIHLKNGIKVGNHVVRVGLADGMINNREFLQLAKAIGYEGPICVEAPRPGDREWFAQQDLAYIKSIVADVGL